VLAAHATHATATLANAALVIHATVDQRELVAVDPTVNAEPSQWLAVDVETVVDAETRRRRQ